MQKIGLSKNQFECSNLVKSIRQFNLNKTELIVDANVNTKNVTHVAGIACASKKFNVDNLNRYYYDVVNEEHGNHTKIVELLETHSSYINSMKNILAVAVAIGLVYILIKSVMLYRRQRIIALIQATNSGLRDFGSTNISTGFE